MPKDLQREGVRLKVYKYEGPFIPAYLDDYQLSVDEFRLYCHISRRGDCFESVYDMARFIGVSERTARSALNVLMRAGLVEREARGYQLYIYRTCAYSNWANNAELPGIRAEVRSYRKTKLTGEAERSSVASTETSVVGTAPNIEQCGTGNQGVLVLATEVYGTSNRGVRYHQPTKVIP